jgi:L-ascorbate metabolism protein UlaG (beta-lactamase superfamily)
MQVEWYGQSAFRLSAGDTTVFIDPFGDVSGLASRGLEFNYPAISGVDAHLGEVIGIASEHDDAAGTERGPNTIYVFELDGVRVAHFGDFGQSKLRAPQAEAIGKVDLLFIPVGGGATIGDEQAAAIAEQVGARWIVPMHYRTPKVSFLETADAFLERMPNVERLAGPSFDTADLPGDEPLAVVPAAP